MLIDQQKDVFMNVRMDYLEMMMVEIVQLHAQLHHFIIIWIIKLIVVFQVMIIFNLDCYYPYFADTTSQLCSLTCQFGYFQNLTDHTCQQCP